MFKSTKEMINKTKNVVLIGMPAAGKSTIGVLLAKSLLYSFTDTDLIIQNQYKSSLCDLIKQKGTAEFLRIENDVIGNLDLTSCVIATGGSAVYGKDAMNRLKSNGIVIYLKLPIETLKDRIGDIVTRGVAMPNGKNLDEIFSERAPLYEKYADITLNCSNLSPEECVNICINALGLAI